MGNPGARRLLYAIVLSGAAVVAGALLHEPSTDPLSGMKTAVPSAQNFGSQSPDSPVFARSLNTRPAKASASVTRPGSASVNSLLHTLLALSDNQAITTQELWDVQAALLELLLLGRAAVPDIRGFLLNGDDALFELAGDELYEYASLRIALIDALRQIGGAEAEQALLEQLNAKVSVGELAVIASALEWLQPGYYSDSILEVAQEWLALLSARATPEGPMESGPLFQILQIYSDHDLAATLYQVPYWLQDYAQVALANLPNGQGIDGLAQKARRDLRSGRESRSLHLLAQAAVFTPQAEAALLALVQSDQIPESLWPMIGEILMGDRQLQIGNPLQSPESTGSLRGDNSYATHTIVDRQVQVIYSVNYSAVLSAEQVAARLVLIARLLDLASNPAAISALWDARDALINYY